MQNSQSGAIVERRPLSLNFALWIARQPWFGTVNHDGVLLVWEKWFANLCLLRCMDPAERFAVEQRWVDPQWVPEPFPPDVFAVSWLGQWKTFVTEFQNDRYVERLAIPENIRRLFRSKDFTIPDGRWIVDLVWDPEGRMANFNSDHYAALSMPQNSDPDIFLLAIRHLFGWPK